MSRNSYPDFSSLGAGMGENTSSWVKAYNEVVKDHKSGSNTVSIAELRGKPGVNGLFPKGLNGTLIFHFQKH